MRVRVSVALGVLLLLVGTGCPSPTPNPQATGGGGAGATGGGGMGGSGMAVGSGGAGAGGQSAAASGGGAGGADPCLGVVCNSPPGPEACYQLGQCMGGACSYAFADGSNCDDGNACTGGDSCLSGVCAGTVISCTTPPPDLCLNAGTLRVYQPTGSCTAGSCDYGYNDIACATPCMAGSCTPVCVTVNEVIDPSPQAAWPQVAVHADGTVDAAYALTPNGVGTAWHARRVGPGNWIKTPVFTANDSPSNLDFTPIRGLDTDSVGGLHMLWGANNNVFYAQLPPFSSNWSTPKQAMLNADGVLAVDALDQPHFAVAYYSYPVTYGTYQHEWLGPSGWSNDQVPPYLPNPTDYYHEGTMVADAAGGIHFAYNAAYSNLRYAYWPPGGPWQIEAAGTFNFAGSASMAINANGDIHIVVNDVGTLRHVSKVNGTWNIAQMVQADTTGKQTLAFDPVGDLHLAYRHNNAVYRAKLPNGSSTWTYQMVEPNNANSRVSLAIDPAGGLHIVYGTTTAVMHHYIGCP